MLLLELELMLQLQKYEKMNLDGEILTKKEQELRGIITTENCLLLIFDFRALKSIIQYIYEKSLRT